VVLLKGIKRTGQEGGLKMKPKDLLGAEIKVNSQIIYATRQGNSAVLQQGEVLEIESTGMSYCGEPQFRLKVLGKGNLRAGWVTDTDRVVVVSQLVKGD
jgi:hypothetical protein